MGSVQDFVCPQCGSAAGDTRFCAGCGLELSAQYELPSKEQWGARQAQTQLGNGSPTAVQDPPPRVAVPPSAPGRSRTPDPVRAPAALVGLALSLVGAALVFGASFLHWISFLDESGTMWQIASAADILLAVLAAGLAAAALLVFVRGRLLAARLVLIALTMGVVGWACPLAIEFMVSFEDPISAVQAGEIVALVGAAVLLVAAALQGTYLLFERRSSRPAKSLLLIGLISLAVAGVTEPLIALLPIDSGTSAWEASKVQDIVGAGLDTALVAVALTAIFVADTRLILAAFLLGSYTALGNLVGSIEELAQSSDGAAVFLSMFLMLPLAAAGAVLIAVACANKSVPAES